MPNSKPPEILTPEYRFLEQIEAIASSLTNSQDGAMKKAAKRAMRVLQGIGTALPPGAAMVTICNQLPELVGKIF